MLLLMTLVTLTTKNHSAGVAGSLKIVYLKLVEDQSNTTCEIVTLVRLYLPC